MKPTVYIETTIVSYLTAKPTRGPILRGWMTATKQWWDKARPAFELFTSELVYDEASAGDAKAAAKRIASLAGIQSLQISDKAELLAKTLLSEMALPTKARRDALHVGITASNGIDYLLTWNCRHLANAMLRRKIEDMCLSFGFEPPTICTPMQLMEVES